MIKLKKKQNKKKKRVIIMNLPTYIMGGELLNK